MADATPGDVDAIVALYAELDEFYGAGEGSGEGAAGDHDAPAERAERVRSALFSDPPAGRALLAWDGPVLAGLARDQLLWPSSALTTSLYLKELDVTPAHRRGGVG